MKKYQNYIFDFYGTLVDIKTDEGRTGLWQQLAELYQAFGASYDAQELKTAYSKLVKESEHELAEQVTYEHVEIDLTSIFIRLLQESLKKNPTEGRVIDLATFGQVMANTFRVLSRERLVAYENSLSSLQTLKESGARLFILSNAQRVFTQAEIEGTGCATFMDKIYISSDYQMKKPEPAFLRMVLEENGLCDEESVMVGNDLTSDIAVAHAVGIDSILLNTFPHSQTDIQACKDKGWDFIVIEDIAELLN